MRVNSDTFLMLTEMWQDCKYIEVGKYINASGWIPAETAAFCAYFCKYLGTKELETLYKFI